MTEYAGFAGQKFFVPGFRIAKLGPIHTDTSGDLLPADVAFDVLSVRIVQNHTLPSTYEIVLNNSQLSTGADRAARQRASTSSGTESASDGAARERFAGANPVWPRFKYNDFYFFAFGQRLRIDMRYLPEMEGQGNADDDSSRSALRDEWTPMIAGPITDIKFDLVAGAEQRGMRVTLSGHDDLGRLMDFQDWRCDMDRYSEQGAVRHILEELGLSLPWAEPLVPFPDFFKDRTHGIQLARDANESSLDFLKKLAERYDFELFVAFDLSRADRPLEFHFEPYRGRANPSDPRRILVPLERGKTLLKLDTTINVADQYTEVSVRGRARETAQVIEERGRTNADVLRDELWAPSGGSHGEIQPAPLVREHYYPGRPNPHDPGNTDRLDNVRAKWRAAAILRQKARTLCALDGQTIGIPRLRAGNHVELRGCRPPFDGLYYLTQTTHTINAQGYLTDFKASRPGMEIPDSSHHYVEDLT